MVAHGSNDLQDEAVIAVLLLQQYFSEILTKFIAVEEYGYELGVATSSCLVHDQ